MRSSFGRVGVLMGGPSGEREISLRSGTAVAQALKDRGHEVVRIDPIGDAREKIQGGRIDVAFIALHGSFGEDGQVQEILESQKIPYIGSGIEASRRAIDKVGARRQFERAGVVVPEGIVCTQGARIEMNGLPPPWVVKPARQGSSLGLSVVQDRADLEEAAAEAFRYDPTILIETFVQGRELTVGILGDRPLIPVEIRPADGVFSFKAKYTPGATQYLIPPVLPSSTLARVQETALACHRALGCRHLSRTDLILLPEGKVVALEVNTIPGFTETSLLPKAARAGGLEFPDLCEKLLEMAIHG